MPKKKFFIAHSWTDVGLNIQTKEVAKQLAEMAFVTFISQARINKSEKNNNENLRIIEWPTKRPNNIKDLLFILKKIKKEKPDAIIAHFGATNICMIASWLMRVRFRICWMHTLSEQYFLDSNSKVKARMAIYIRRLMYQLATNIVVQNEFGRRDATRNFKVNNRKIFTIYNGINSAKIFKDEYPPYRSIRFCGRLDNSKGVDVLITAFSKIHLKYPDVMLEIAGRGSEEKVIQRMIEQFDLSSKVKMHGYFNIYTDSLKFISNAYCLVVPSRLDNFPTVILEAMANGVPVIGSNVGGIPEMIANNATGILINSDSPDELSGAMVKILDDHNLRTKMSMNSTNVFNDKFSMRSHVMSVTHFLEDIHALT